MTCNLCITYHVCCLICITYVVLHKLLLTCITYDARVLGIPKIKVLLLTYINNLLQKISSKPGCKIKAALTTWAPVTERKRINGPAGDHPASASQRTRQKRKRRSMHTAHLSVRFDANLTSARLRDWIHATIIFFAISQSTLDTYYDSNLRVN